MRNFRNLARHTRLLSRRRQQRALAVAAMASLAAGLVLAPAAEASAAVVRQDAPHGGPPAGGTTGRPVTVRGPRMYNPAAPHRPLPPSTVTVSQTAGLTDQLVHVNWTNFTPSNLNGGGPDYQSTLTDYAVMAVECRGADPASWTDCYEADTEGLPQTSGPAGPPNAAYAITTAHGTGQGNFYVETTQENGFLGCDQRRPCSLVIVPGQGGTPPAAPGGQPRCQDHRADLSFPGNAVGRSTFSGPPVSSGGLLACSWAKRVVVPLHFAATPATCPRRPAAFGAEGSPMLAAAMRQWLTGLCAGRRGLAIAYNSAAGEPLAVQDAVSGRTDVALTTRPASADGIPAGGRHFVYAPVAVSAVSAAYWLDNTTTGQPASGLRLDQRLLAKLLTTSYNPGVACPPDDQRNCDPGVRHNPFDMYGNGQFRVPGDPEFHRLNPALYQRVGGSQTYLVPTVQAGPSDMTWTATRWIGASPAARSFLAGTPDPYGMHVNTYYRGLHYPADAFTPRDPTLPYVNLYQPVFPLAQAVTYQALNLDAGYNIPVPPPSTGYTKDPPEPAGDRALLAILDQADAALNRFPVAAVPNAAGAYVQPTGAAMAAALSHMVSDGSGTLQVNLANKDPRAYPLTMVIYAMAPTSGLSRAKARAIARFLDFTAGTGQMPGARPGQLPAGYLPLTAGLRAQTRRAAEEVAGQAGGSSR